MNYKLYWGEMHTHTYCGRGVFGKIEDAVEIAKAHLDFWAPGEHLGKDHNGFNWSRIKKVIAENNDPGKFVTFSGFEYGSLDGDYNAYFLEDDVPEFTPEDLPPLVEFARKQNGKAILIPHHTGYKVGCRGTDWDNFSEDVMPLVEIFSMHGSSECEFGPFPMDLHWMAPRATAGTVQAGLAKGKKFGFMASSDGHDAYPGCYKMGLTAVYTKELTRESIWEAFLKRHTYAVTGDRIKLEFNLNNHFMGDDFNDSGRRRISAKVEGDDLLDKVEIIKNNKIFYRTSANLNREYSANQKGRFKIRVEWGWGKNEIVKWEGKLKIQGGRILSAQPCFGSPPPNKILSLDEKSCEWLSHTNGAYFFRWNGNRNGREGTNSIVFEIEGNTGSILFIETRGRNFKYTIKELMESSRIEIMGERTPDMWNFPKLKIYEPVPEKQYKTEISLIDDKKEKSTDFYYLRATQANGQMAWSSPIWINK